VWGVFEGVGDWVRGRKRRRKRGERDLVSIVGTMTWGCYKWIIISCLCTHVKWVTILMLDIYT